MVSDQQLQDLAAYHHSTRLDEAWFKLNSLRNDFSGKRHLTPDEYQQYTNHIIFILQEAAQFRRQSS